MAAHARCACFKRATASPHRHDVAQVDHDLLSAVCEQLVDGQTQAHRCVAVDLTLRVELENHEVSPRVRVRGSGLAHIATGRVGAQRSVRG